MLRLLAFLALVFSAACWPAAPARAQAGQWPNQPPSDSPFARSDRFSGVKFPGRYVNYARSDTWYPSWGADGRLYSPYMDGECVGGVQGSWGGQATSVMGVAAIDGDDPTKLKFSCKPPLRRSSGAYDGRYSSATLHHKGIWYYGSYLLEHDAPPATQHCNSPYCTLGPFVGFEISTDGGATWQAGPDPGTPLFGESTFLGQRVRLGALHFVDFGRDMQHSPDGYAYLVGHGGTNLLSQNSWAAGDDVYLTRVRPSPGTINDPAAYEFFAGHQDGHPVWTSDISAMKPLISWPGHLGQTTITYDAPQRTYLMWVSAPTDGVDGQGTFDTMLLEAPALTGPWRMVHYMPQFGPQAYFVHSPSKFVDPGGRRMWMGYSANYAGPWKGTAGTPQGSTYTYVLREMELVPAGSSPAPAGPPPAGEPLPLPVATPTPPADPGAQESTGDASGGPRPSARESRTARPVKIVMPSARRCLSGSRLTVRLVRRRGVRLHGLSAYAGSRHLRLKRRGARVTMTLPRRGPRVLRIELIIDSSGGTVTAKRGYRSCSRPRGR